MPYHVNVSRLIEAISLIYKRHEEKDEDKERELSCLHFYKLSFSNCSNSFYPSYQRFYCIDT